MSDFGYTFSTDCLTLDDFEHTHTVSQSHQNQTPTITPSASRCHLPTPPKTPSRTKKRSSAQLKTPRKVSLPKTGEKSRALHKRGSSACKGCRALKRLCTGNWGETCATCARTGKVCEWDGSLKGAKISMMKAMARQMENGSLYESIHTIMATPEPEPGSVTPSVTPTSLTTTANAAPISYSSSMSSPFASVENFCRPGVADASIATTFSAEIPAGLVDCPLFHSMDPTTFHTPTAILASTSGSMSFQTGPEEDIINRLRMADLNVEAAPSAAMPAGFVDSPSHLSFDGPTAFTTSTTDPAPISSSMTFQTTPEMDASYWLDFFNPNVAATPSAGIPATLDDPDFHPDIDPTAFTTPTVVPAPSSSSMSFQTTPDMDASYWFDFSDPNVAATPSAGNPAALVDSDFHPDIDPTAFTTPTVVPAPSSSSMSFQTTPELNASYWFDLSDPNVVATLSAGNTAALVDSAGHSSSLAYPASIHSPPSFIPPGTVRPGAYCCRVASAAEDCSLSGAGLRQPAED